MDLVENHVSSRKVVVIFRQLYCYMVDSTGIIHTNKNMKEMDLSDELYD